MKTLTLLIDGGYAVEVRLYASKRGLQRAIKRQKCSRNPWADISGITYDTPRGEIRRVDDGYRWKQYAMLWFHAGNLEPSVVAHECLHAAILYPPFQKRLPREAKTLWKRRKNLPPKSERDGQIEENIADLQELMMWLILTKWDKKRKRKKHEVVETDASEKARKAWRERRGSHYEADDTR